MQLYPDQQELIGQTRQAMSMHKSVLMVSPTGSGKCLGKDTPVLMFNGTIKMVQDIKIGDRLMGFNNKPRLVLSTCSGIENLYHVIPTKGEPWVCNESHILSLKKTGDSYTTRHGRKYVPKGEIVNITVKDYLEKSTTFKHLYKQYRSGANFSKKKKLPLCPYFFGVWLGDGTSAWTDITTMDAEIITTIKQEAKNHGLYVRKEPAGGKSSCYHMTCGRKGGHNSLLQKLRKMDVINNKHIPHRYKTASKKDRLSLLAGLIDTDGSSSNGGVDFISKRRELSEDVCFVARSLGFAAYMKECQKKCHNNGVTKTYYRVSISGDLSKIPCRIKRKILKPRLQKKDHLVTGFTLQPLGGGEYFGFELDGDGLFLLGDFTVTHNTAMALYMIKAAQAKGKRILFSTPRRDLLDQTSETFRAMGVEHSYVAAGRAYNPFSSVYIGMLPSMDRRTNRLPPVDLLIVDEAHYGSGAMDRVITQYKQAGAYLLGLSASPWKLSGQGLGVWYDSMVQGKSVRWLIDNKRLSDYRYFYGRTKPDLSKLTVTAGDYAKGEMALYMEEQGAIIGDCVEDYRTRCMGNIHVVRCASIKHSQMTADAFRAAGIPAMHVDGETPTKERRRIFKALAMRQVRVVTFVDLLVFGFDLSQAAQMDVCIESLSDLKPTKSLAGMLQYWGRALRMKDKPAVINDHVNNYVEHYFPDTPREWTLESREQGKRASGERAMPVSACPRCYFAFRPAPICPNCGEVIAVKSREIETVAGELHEMTREERDAMKKKEVRDRKREQAMAKTFPELLALGRKRGMKNPAGWAAFIMNAREK